MRTVDHFLRHISQGTGERSGSRTGLDLERPDAHPQTVSCRPVIGQTPREPATASADQGGSRHCLRDGPGGIAQVDIARARGISAVTLRKHHRNEIDAGTTALNTIVLIEHVKRIKAGDFQAIKWWERSRMGWSERIVVDDGKQADTPMRVIVELVGEAAAPRGDQSAPRSGSHLSENLRETVQLGGEMAPAGPRHH